MTSLIIYAYLTKHVGRAIIDVYNKNMKTLNIKLEYGLTKDVNNITSQELTIDYLTNGINMKYQGGLEGQLRRVFGRVQRKFDEALDKKSDVLELEDAEFDLLEKSFAEAKFPPALSKYVNILELELERCAKA